MQEQYNDTKTPFYTTFRIESSLRDRLRDLKRDFGFATYQGLFNYLTLEVKKNDTIPFASRDQIFRDSKPVIITGKSGSGKTTAMKNLLSNYEGSVFLLDVSNEYLDFQRIDLGEFFSYDWKSQRDSRIRIVPNSQIEISKTEAATIFSHINFIKNSGDLKDWTFIIEEGHRFGADSNLRTLLLEARKFMRKFLLITADYQTFKDIASVFKSSE